MASSHSPAALVVKIMKYVYTAFSFCPPVHLPLWVPLSPSSNNEVMQGVIHSTRGLQKSGPCDNQQPFKISFWAELVVKSFEYHLESLFSCHMSCIQQNESSSDSLVTFTVFCGLFGNFLRDSSMATLRAKKLHSCSVPRSLYVPWGRGQETSICSLPASQYILVSAKTRHLYCFLVAKTQQAGVK